MEFVFPISRIKSSLLEQDGLRSDEPLTDLGLSRSTKWRLDRERLMYETNFRSQGQSTTRRSFLRDAAGLAGAAALGSVVGGSSSARAATSTVKGYGVTTAQLKDWSIMTKSNGVTMDYTATNADIGIFMRDVVSNDLGEVNDIFIFDGGTERILGPQGYYAEIDENHPELKLWKRTPDSWKRSDFLRANGKQYGVPVIGNGDCFGYFPKTIEAQPERARRDPLDHFLRE